MGGPERTYALHEVVIWGEGEGRGCWLPKLFEYLRDILIVISWWIIDRVS